MPGWVNLSRLCHVSSLEPSSGFSFFSFQLRANAVTGLGKQHIFFQVSLHRLQSNQQHCSVMSTRYDKRYPRLVPNALHSYSPAL